MRLERDNCDARYQIKAYETGSVTVNDTRYDHSLIVTANTLIPNWDPSDFQAIIALQPEIIILGTGLTFERPDDTLLKQLDDAQIGFEYMDTGAACRTFTVLLAEGRQVAAGLKL
ncbi:MAG: Mth938-like domain-containing protein [Gammaproteobacteria bacterium]|nr:Mth938-like domain-containing protein [Gammaproteobacteria bacterium]MCH9743881.1 Mth938-like domain-containing protein [Gammaproteobacteria bacterium]